MQTLDTCIAEYTGVYICSVRQVTMYSLWWKIHLKIMWKEGSVIFADISNAYNRAYCSIADYFPEEGGRKGGGLLSSN